MPPTSRPSIFDMTGRAKWDAWAAAGKKYENAVEAEQRYLDLARSLGWIECYIVPPKEDKEDRSVDDDSIWDSFDEPSSSRSGGGGGGMGVAVSSLAQPQNINDSSIHGLVLSNDVPSLKAFLTNYPETNLNALDEFVSNKLLCSRSLMLKFQFLLGICPITFSLRSRECGGG